eukprot:g837.t1
MTSCTILDNTAEGKSGGCGGMMLSAGEVTMLSCVVSGNKAIGTAISSGGGVCISTSVIMTSCTVVGNTATANPGIKLESSGVLTLDGETAVQKECRAGQYVTNSLGCSPCPSGTYRALLNLSWPCKNCPAGRYGTSPETTNDQCSGKCAAGRYGTGGSTTEQCTGACPAGSYSIIGSGKTPGCTGCPAGRYGAIFGETNDQCSGECAAGSYSIAGSSSCKNCPAGRYGSGGSTSDQCNGECAPGRYGTGGSRNDQCSGACSAGRFGTGGSTNDLCSGACPAGSFSTAGSGTSNSCTDCPAGRYGTGGSTSDRCSGPCEVGRYGTGRSSSNQCTAPCPAGRYGDVAGQTNEQCTGPCPAGRYGNSGSTTSECTGACQIGRYGVTGQTSDQCSGPCKAGRYGSGGSTTDECTGECLAGTYSALGSGQCSLCEPGFYNDKSGQEVCNKTCTVGKYSLQGFDRCIDCIPGRAGVLCNTTCGFGNYSYQGQVSCSRCRAGFYSDTVEAGSCKPCNAGFFNPLEGQNSCTRKCQSGTFSNEGASTCIACQVGKIVDKTFGYSTMNCGGDCGAGRYRDASSSACKSCEAGRYSNAAAIGACKSCEPGYVNPSEGQTSCTTKCEIGKYSFTGSVRCLLCPGGTRGTQMAATSLEDGCLECEQGKFSNDTGGHEYCTECNIPGTYCPAGATKPELCSPDKFCDGQTIQDRPRKPKDIVVQNIPNTNAINVSWKLDLKDKKEVGGTFRVLYTTRKDTPLADMVQILVDDNKEIRKLSISEKRYYVKIGNLRVGTQYFVRVLRLENKGESSPTESQPSELSDKVEMRCPDGAYCGPPGGPGVQVSETVNLQGYFKVNNLTFIKCEVPTNCPGVVKDSSGEAIAKNATKAGCPDGYRGLMCLKCEENYTRQGDTCNECGSQALQMFWMFGALVVGVCMFSYLIYKNIRGEGNPKDVQSGILKIALRQFQLIGIISQFPLSWTDSIKGMFDAFSTVSNAGSQAFTADCFTKTSYVANSLLNLSMPIGILIFFWIMISRIYRGSKEARTRNLKLSTIVILMTLHPTLVKRILGFFQCTKPVIGKTYLIADVDIQCRSSTHLTLVLTLGVPALIVYTLGIPAVAGINLYMNRDNLDDVNTRKTFGFLYSNYEKKYYFWELIIILRLVAMAGVSVLFEGNPAMQATLGSQVLFLAMFLHMICRPFEKDMLDTVETYSLASSVVSLTCGNLLLNRTTPEEWKSFATVLIFLSMFAFTFYCIGLSVYVYKHREEIANRQTERHRDKTGGIEMITNPAGERHSTLKTILMQSNPMNKFMTRMKNQFANVKLKGQAKNKMTESSTANSHERQSTDLVIGAAGRSDKWVKYTDLKSGEPYWHNPVTDETTWENPKIHHNRPGSHWT